MLTSSLSLTDPHAGPSRPVRPLRKPKSPNPSRPSSTTTRLRPPLPARPNLGAGPGPPLPTPPTLPTKTLQGVGTRRTDAVRVEYGRNVILVTRKTGLGTYLGRARSLVVDEGYTHLTIHALSAAIPHALLLLHSLLDILPFPLGRGGMRYEIRTGSVECVDEVAAGRTDKRESTDGEGNEEEEAFKGIGEVEEDEPVLRKRITSSIQIDLYISPKSTSTTEIDGVAQSAPPTSLGDGRRKKREGKNRPSKGKRRAMARAREKVRGEGSGAVVEGEEDGLMDVDEEDAMNG